MSKTDKGFFIFFDWIDRLCDLPPQDAIDILIALAEYSRNGEDPTEKFSGALRCVVALMYDQIKRSEKISEVRAIAGQKGGISKATPNLLEQSKANISKAKQRQTTITNTNTITNTLKEERDFVSKEESNRYADRFARFWSAYPKKVGKGDAEKRFMKLKPSEELTEQMIRAVEAQKKSAQWVRDNGQYIPHPSTWLSQERWRDELPRSPYDTTEEEREAEYQRAFKALGIT